MWQVLNCQCHAKRGWGSVNNMRDGWQKKDKIWGRGGEKIIMGSAKFFIPSLRISNRNTLTNICKSCSDNLTCGYFDADDSSASVSDGKRFLYGYVSIERDTAHVHDGWCTHHDVTHLPDVTHYQTKWPVTWKDKTYTDYFTCIICVGYNINRL